MRRVSIVVNVEYDPEAGVWFATSEDVRGLAVEGEDLDALAKNVLTALPTLIELNGLPSRRLDRVASLFGFGRRSRKVEVDIRQHATLSGLSAAC